VCYIYIHECVTRATIVPCKFSFLRFCVTSLQNKMSTKDVCVFLVPFVFFLGNVHMSFFFTLCFLVVKKDETAYIIKMCFYVLTCKMCSFVYTHIFIVVCVLQNIYILSCVVMDMDNILHS